MASVRGFRTTTAYVVWVLCVVLALVLAGGAALVALRADAGHVVWGPWLEVVDLVTFEWFARPDGVSLAAASERETVLRWGAASVAVLVLGAVAQWMVRPRRG